jgi:hypothetical protein
MCHVEFAWKGRRDHLACELLPRAMPGSAPDRGAERAGLGRSRIALAGGDWHFDIATLIVQRAKPLMGPCRLLTEKSLFRRMRLGYTVVWHIDADTAPRTDDLCMNVWVPLASVGKSRPSIELIQGPHQIMRLELPPPNANRDPEWVNERFAHSFREIP